MGEVRPRRSGYAARVAPRRRGVNAHRARRALRCRPRGQRGTPATASTGAARCGVDPDVRARGPVWRCVAGLSGNAGARGGTGRRFPRRRPAAPLLGPLDATTATTSTSSPTDAPREGCASRAGHQGMQRRRAAERASRGPLRLSASTARSHAASPLAPAGRYALRAPLPLVATLSRSALRAPRLPVPTVLRLRHRRSGCALRCPGRSRRYRVGASRWVQQRAGARPTGVRATSGCDDRSRWAWSLSQGIAGASGRRAAG